MPRRVFKRQSVFVTDELVIGNENKYKKLFSLPSPFLYLSRTGFALQRVRHHGRMSCKSIGPLCVGLATTCWMPLWKLKQIGKHNKARLAAALLESPFKRKLFEFDDA